MTFILILNQGFKKVLQEYCLELEIANIIQL